MHISPDDFSALSGRLARAVPCLSGALSVSDESVFCEDAGPVTLLYIIERCLIPKTDL